MKNDAQDLQVIDAALARLPEWQPPPGFAARVTLIAAEREAWAPLLLRGMGIAACVSAAAWLGGELLYAGMISMAAQDAPGVLGWGLSGAALLFASRLAMPSRFRA
jgi:negative regulator of sigma E activity